MGLLDRGLANVELTRLTVVVGESLRPGTLLLALFFGRKGIKTELRRFSRAADRRAP